MDSAALRELLEQHDACGEATDWAQGKEPEVAWKECERGDWLLWIAAQVGVDTKLLVMAACACARRALVHVPEAEGRPLRAIETAEAWTRGEAALDDVQEAAWAAAEAAWAAAEAAAWAAARAAARAAAEAAWAAGAARAARAAELRACAEAVRSIIPYETVLAAYALSQETALG